MKYHKKMWGEKNKDYSDNESSGRRIVKSAWKGSRAVAMAAVSGLAFAFGAREIRD
jgi:hypothetical protein